MRTAMWSSGDLETSLWIFTGIGCMKSGTIAFTILMEISWGQGIDIFLCFLVLASYVIKIEHEGRRTILYERRNRKPKVF